MSELNPIAKKIIEVMVETEKSETHIQEMRDYLKGETDYETIFDSLILDTDDKKLLAEKLCISYEKFHSLKMIMSEIYFNLHHENFTDEEMQHI